MLPQRKEESLVAGLTSNGYIARTAGEWFDVAKTEYNKVCADLGVSQPRYDKAEFVTVVLLIVAQIASEIDNAVATIFDQHDPNQTSGVILRFLATVAGVVVDPGSKSRATLTLGGWDSGAVPLTAGDAKASDGTTTWVLLEDVVIPAGGTATAVFEAQEVGPTLATAGTINRRASGVAGWQTVTNENDASPGSYAESDASIRNKIARGQGGTGSRSPLSIKAALERLPGVQKVRLVYNKNLTPTTVSTRTIPENGVGVWIYPPDLTQEVRGQALSILFAMVGGNVNRSLPSVTGDEGVVGTVLGADERLHSEGFWYMTSTPFVVDVFIDPLTGFEPGGNLLTVQEPIREVVRTYFANLEPGETVRHDDLLGLIAGVSGVARSTLRFDKDGGGFSSDDQTVDPASFPQIDASGLQGGVIVRTTPLI